MRFRKKPVVIEAIQWTGNNLDAIRDFAGSAVWDPAETPPLSLAITTLEGIMRVSPHDWIIKGIQTEVYPCKPDIFAATYEPADAPLPDPGSVEEWARRIYDVEVEAWKQTEAGMTDVGPDWDHAIAFERAQCLAVAALVVRALAQQARELVMAAETAGREVFAENARLRAMLPTQSPAGASIEVPAQPNRP